MSSKLKTKLTILLLSFVLVLGISCQKKTLAIENHSNSSPKQDEYEAPVANQSDETEKTSDFTAYRDDSDIIPQKDIFFEFDKATLTTDAMEILKNNSQWLRTNTDIAITIEGHCDERGTNEYNLALGERRAESVKTFLVDSGIDQSRLTIISYGEERPFVQGHGQSSWARNRRAHFLIK